MLEQRGISGKVWINFNPEINEGAYMENVDNDNNPDDTIYNENGNISTAKPSDGMNLNNISNGAGRLAEVSS